MQEFGERDQALVVAKILGFSVFERAKVLGLSVFEGAKILGFSVFERAQDGVTAKVPIFDGFEQVLNIVFSDMT